VKIFDKRADAEYGTGAIVNIAKVSPMPKAGGRWNNTEITVKGPRLNRHIQRYPHRRCSGHQARTGTDHDSVRRRYREVPQAGDQTAVGIARRNEVRA
jgi:hypothetical protein